MPSRRYDDVTVIELGKPLPDLKVRLAVGALNMFEIELSTTDGTALSLTGTTVQLELGSTTVAGVIVGNVVTFTVASAASTRALIDTTAKLVMVNGGERTVVAQGRSVAA